MRVTPLRLMIVGPMGGPFAEAARIALSQGAKVIQADSPDQALAFLRAGKGGDLLLVDCAFQIGDLIRRAEAERIRVPVIACGVGIDARRAADAVRQGARDFLPLPPDPELIAAMIQAMSQESRTMVARDPAMLAALDLADRAAASDATILILGESGVGKEVLARRIHMASRRASGPFVSVNCAAIPEALLESELFGHEKGAFTGALARRVGKFEAASGGTLLLDEISEMDLRLQAKLLRALQERMIDRVGGADPVPVDLRILATSNRDLAGEARAGRFREDLYFRLSVVPVTLPPLRERPDDILPLAEHFLALHAKAAGVEPPLLSEAARAALRARPWRGNARELENAMHRALILARGPRIEPEDLGPDAPAAAAAGARDNAGQAMRDARLATSEARTSNPAAAIPAAAGAGLVGRTLDAVERDLILDTLGHCGGNRTRAAAMLGISIRTLRNKLKLYLDTGALPALAACG